MTIEVRNVRFDLDARVPRRWHGGGAAVTTFFNNLSVVFPVGERFFIATVKAHADAVTDPTLREHVRAFCAQEGVHGREHDRYNAWLAAQGYPVEAMERRVKGILAFVRKRLPPRWQLAATCGLEHFTATLGHLVLSQPRALEGAHERMTALWRWHAAEEIEHKAVAYDVFLAAGGTYAERVGIMALASVIFWAKIFEQQVRMMSADGTAGSPAEWAALARWLYVEPGALRRLVVPYLRYYAPGFHPRAIDDRAALAAWRAANELDARYARAA